jgi:hypothetical protein
MNVACAPPATDATYAKDCKLNSDQQGSLIGVWAVAPIIVSFQKGAWSTEEETLIIKAMDTWNDFFSSVHGFKIFDYGSVDSVRESSTTKPSSVCTQKIVNNGQFTGSVVIYKQASWLVAHSNMTNVMALTSSCPRPASPLAKINMAIMEANYQNFFVAGKPQADLQTVFLHEFGHLLGLGHSCSYDTSTSTTLIQCSSSSIDKDYVGAVMYPVVSQNSKKRTLESNDQERSNCLYTQ